MPKETAVLRDKFAAEALQGLLAWDAPDLSDGFTGTRYFNRKAELDADGLADDAYIIADAMIRRRGKK